MVIICVWIRNANVPDKFPSPRRSLWHFAEPLEWSFYLFKRLTLRALLISFIDLWWFKIQRTLCQSTSQCHRRRRCYSLCGHCLFIRRWIRNTKDARRRDWTQLSLSAKCMELWPVRIFSKALNLRPFTSKSIIGRYCTTVDMLFQFSTH